MTMLENVEINDDINADDFRFPVQYVTRPNLNFRGFAGTVVSGQIKPGDSITALPSGKQSKVKALVNFEGEQELPMHRLPPLSHLKMKLIFLAVT